MNKCIKLIKCDMAITLDETNKFIIKFMRFGERKLPPILKRKPNDITKSAYGNIFYYKYTATKITEKYEYKEGKNDKRLMINNFIERIFYASHQSRFIVKVRPIESSSQYAYQMIKYDGNLHTLREEISSENMETIFYQMLCAIDGIHNNGMIYGDMKPDNILVRKIGQTYEARLTDFGSISYVTDIPLNCESIKQTYIYGAPELFKDSFVIDYSMDIWSLGATFLDIYTDFFRKLCDSLKSDDRTYRFYRGFYENFKESDIPPLPDNAPIIIKKLVPRMLVLDPKKRLTLNQLRNPFDGMPSLLSTYSNPIHPEPIINKYNESSYHLRETLIHSIWVEKTVPNQLKPSIVYAFDKFMECGLFETTNEIKLVFQTAMNVVLSIRWRSKRMIHRFPMEPEADKLYKSFSDDLYIIFLQKLNYKVLYYFPNITEEILFDIDKFNQAIKV